MQQHAVPQNVTSFEFKIVGFLTLKQFAIIGTCTVIGFILYLSLNNYFIKIGAAAICILIGIALTFGSVQQIPFYRWILIFVKAIFSPTQRIWIKAAKAPDYFYTTYAQDVKPVDKRIFEDRSKLSSYLQTLPSNTNSPLDVVEQQRLQSLSLQRNPRNKEPLIVTPQISQTPPVQLPDAPKPQSTIMPAHDISKLSITQNNGSQPSSPPNISTPTAPQAKPAPFNPSVFTPPSIQISPQKPAPVNPPIINPTPKPTNPPQPAPTPPPMASPQRPPVPTPPPTPSIPAPAINPVQTLQNLPPIQNSQPKVNNTQPANISQTISSAKPVNNSKIWSTFQKMEREYLEELKRIQQDSAAKQEQEIKAREDKIISDKQTQIDILEKKLNDQQNTITKLQKEFEQKEQGYIQQLQEKLEAEKSKREEYEKTANLLKEKIDKLTTEKTKAEQELNNQQNQTAESTNLLKQQLQDTNKQIESLRQEAATRLSEEQQRQQTESQSLKDEYEKQSRSLAQDKIALDQEKAKIEKQHQDTISQIQSEKEKLQKQNQQLLEEKARLEKINNELVEKQKQLQNTPEKQSKKSTKTTDITLPPITPPIDVSDLTKTEDLDQLAQKLHEETSKIDKPATKPKLVNTPKITTTPVILPPEPPKVTPSVKLSDQKIITQLNTANIPPITNLINVINGVVYDKSGNFVPNVIIIVKDVDKAPVRALKTNRLGQFAISTPLPNGTYTMEFEDSREEKQFDIYQITLTGSVVPPVEIKEKQ